MPDPLADFVATALVVDPDSEVRASELYAHYQVWARREGIPDRQEVKHREFGERMAGRFRREDRTTGRVYHGVARKVEAP